MRRVLMLLTALLLAVVTAACADDSVDNSGTADSGNSQDTGGGGGGEATLQAPAFAYPETVQVVAGQAAEFAIQVNNPDGLAITWEVAAPTLGSVSLHAQTATEARFRVLATGAEAGEHALTITARWDGGEEAQTVTLQVAPVPCYYPAPVAFGFGLPFPDLFWPARLGDGTDFEFDLYDFYCNDQAWGNYETLAIVVIADWCPNCPAYVRYVDALSPILEEAGMAILYLDAQDRGGRPIGTANADRYIQTLTPLGSGIRVGDADNGLEPDAVLMSPLVEYFPTSVILRRSDMTLIADQRDSNYRLPFAEIALDPERDWSRPPIPEIMPEFPANCGPDDEESWEPNNNEDEAPTFREAISFEGGICDTEADMYFIDIEGEWTIQIEFDARVGDLDIYAWDTERQRPLVDGEGRTIGSATDGSPETFSHEGPAMLYIHGYRLSTTTYTFTLTTP